MRTPKQIKVQFIERMDSASVGSFNKGQIIECTLLAFGTNWIKVKLPMHGRIKTLFNFEAKAIS